MSSALSGKAAIAGIGATDFSKNSGRSELRLASEAVLDALDDAGLTAADVDGMVTFTMDSNTEVAIARATGIGELKFFSKIHHGGSAACATVQQAAIAVATGVADCVVAYRAFNERSGQRFGQVQMRLVELHVKTPARDMPMVAPDQVPGLVVMVPRSRFWREVSVSGFTTFAVTLAF